MTKDIWTELRLRFKTGCRPEVDCGPGWKELLVQLCQALDKAWDGYDELVIGKECWRFLEVKEKMAALVVRAEVVMKLTKADPPSIVKNYENRTKIFQTLLSKAHEKSKEVCEECGESGVKRFLVGVFKTLCDRCFLAWDAKESQTT